MISPWWDSIRIERLMLLVKHSLSPRVELRFAKYQVASRPGGDVLRRRLLSRLQAAGARGRRTANQAGQSKPAVRGLSSGLNGRVLVL